MFLRTVPPTSGVEPLIVSEPMRSPTCVLQPATVWCANCCAMDQYKYLKLVRLTVVALSALADFSATCKSMSWLFFASCCRSGSGVNSGSAPSNPSPRAGVAIGDRALDLAVLEEAHLFDGLIGSQKVFICNRLNEFIALGKPA